MKKLSKILKSYNHLFTELDFPGLNLNHNHDLEIYKGNDFCNFGIYPLMSYSHSAHLYIVIIPQIGMPIEEWPIAFYDEEEGIANTFSSSIKTWFPSYLIYQINERYPSHLDSDIITSLKENKDKIVIHGKKFMTDFDAFYDDILTMLDKEGSWDIHYWMEKIEPDSFLTQYYQLKKENTSFEKWEAFIYKYPFFNRALHDQLFTESVRFKYEDSNLNLDLCYEFWNRSFRIDLPYDHILSAVTKIIAKQKETRMSIYHPFIDKINKVITEDEHGYYEGSDGFLMIGKQFKKQGEYQKAIRCFENSILLGGKEEEEFNKKAYKHIVTCAKEIGDQNYLAYLKETKIEV